ncbi:dihydrofolate reductase [Onygenales sp. PD_12]|nr:dihydrofolate reductase [Onygenales sp. PD_12]
MSTTPPNPISPTTPATTTTMPPRPHLPTTTSTTSTTPLLPPLTLIVATTPITTPKNASSHRRLGIGHAGTLPWPRIKSDMTFFSRVTTRPPPPFSPPSSPHERSAINAVIMGRKTYDSLPARFRPLPGRVNVVITRDVSGRERGRVEAEWRAAGERERKREEEKKRERDGGVGVGVDGVGGSGTSGPDTTTITTTQSQSQSVPEADAEAEQTPDILVSNSLDSALTALADAFKPGPPAPGKLTRDGTRRLGAVYVIGGAEIYASALGMGGLGGKGMRIVMTDIRRVGEGVDDVDVENAVDGYECDTFFPVDGEELVGEGGGWKGVGKGELEGWVGEEVGEGWVREGEVRLRVRGFERV